MEKTDKSISEFAEALQAMISKYRCSFTDDERVLLQECITKMEGARAEPDWLKAAQDVANILAKIAHIFSSFEHFKDWF